MKIQLMSDLHLEFYRNGRNKRPELKVENGVDVLVLAGDIDVGIDSIIEELIYWSGHVDDVVYVAGNHEHYNGVLTINEFNKNLKEYFKDTNVHILDCSEYIKIQDVTFFGGTLWTNFRYDVYDPVSRSQMIAGKNIADFRVIKDFKPTDAIKEFNNQCAFIKHSYENVKGKKVVVTHFLPAVECISERFRTSHGIESELNKYFANDLGGWISTLENTTWLFGHTHDMIDIQLSSTRLLSNPMGYPGEFNRQYKPLILEI